tara:strand:+ start:432 stop:1604 length:1173 start_codon:yes stop_codon:yes gene_type:complete
MKSNKVKNKILVLCDYFEPGFRAGGPITTLSSMVSRLSSQFNYYIVTRDRDFLSKKPYEIKLDSWLINSDSKRYYISKHKFSIWLIKNLIDELSPDVIYLNSFFSYKFSITVIILKKLKLINNCNIIICPRGEFKDSALAKGKIKKLLYIKLSKIFSFYSNIIWQATNEKEDFYIKRIFGSEIKSIVASNLTRPLIQKNDLIFNVKTKDSLKLVYVGRIHKIKNLFYKLEILSHINGNIDFDIIGSVQDAEYWEKCKLKINSLPDNINVNYLGDMPNNKVVKYLKNYHFLFLLTLGENFGQSIFESLSVGLPVIISNQTPWNSIEKDNGGWALPLDDKNRIVNRINDCINMPQSIYNTYVEGAFNCALNYDNNSGALEANKMMFNSLIRS